LIAGVAGRLKAKRRGERKCSSCSRLIPPTIKMHQQKLVDEFSSTLLESLTLEESSYQRRKSNTFGEF